LHHDGGANCSRTKTTKPTHRPDAARPQAVSAARDAAQLALKVASSWAESKPWINATDADELVEKVRGRGG